MFLNPNIVKPAGPINPFVGFILIKDAANDHPLASFTNYALHLDIVKQYGTVYHNEGKGSRNTVSADYPYWLEESLREDFGENFNSIFFTGCCGNINHWDFSKPGPQSGYKTKSKEVGDSLYKTIKRILPHLKNETPSLAIRSKEVNVPLQSFTNEDLTWAKKLDNTALSSKSEKIDERRQFLNSIRKKRILWLNKQKEKGIASLSLDIQVFRLSKNTAIVTLPGEMFVEHGLILKNHSPFDKTIVVELANNCEISYVPTKLAFRQGGYEVENSRLTLGGGEMLVEAAIQLLKELKIVDH
jgi:hypothetical protein